MSGSESMPTLLLRSFSSGAASYRGQRAIRDNDAGRARVTRTALVSGTARCSHARRWRGRGRDGRRAVLPRRAEREGGQQLQMPAVSRLYASASGENSGNRHVAALNGAVKARAV